MPLEIPLAVMMSVMSWRLVRDGVTIGFSGAEVHPDLWTLVLAPSGAGKTTSRKLICEALGVEKDELFPTADSAAKFVDDLSACDGRALWVRDEFGQLLKEIGKVSSPMSQLREYLLRLFDHDKIERRSRKAEISVEFPVMTILGLTVDQTFRKCVDLEMMLDGLAQRFSVLLARPDPARPWRERSRFELDAVRRQVRAAGAKIRAVPVAGRYSVSAEATKTFDDAFLAEASETELPESYFRRAAWRATQYALVYHVLLAKGTAEIDAEDMGWAMRLVRMHLEDAYEVVRMVDTTDFVDRLEKCDAWIQRRRARGRPITARDMVAGVRDIQSAHEATGMLRILGVPC